jgi:hypothetical protein
VNESNVIFPELPTYIGVPSLAGLLSLILTVALPVLAALFMRVQWSAFAKGLVLLAFSAIKAILEAWFMAADAHTAFDVGQTAWTVCVQFILAVVAYVGLLRNTSIQQSAIQGGVIRSRVVDGQVV